jgi:hypothetical protein
MGSATYYLKAKFRSHEDLKAVFLDIKQFLIEGARAEDWWQQHRSMENRGTRKEFWDQCEHNIYRFNMDARDSHRCDLTASIFQICLRRYHTMYCR